MGTSVKPTTKIVGIHFNGELDIILVDVQSPEGVVRAIPIEKLQGQCIDDINIVAKRGPWLDINGRKNIKDIKILIAGIEVLSHTGLVVNNKITAYHRVIGYTVGLNATVRDTTGVHTVTAREFKFTVPKDKLYWVSKVFKLRDFTLSGKCESYSFIKKDTCKRGMSEISSVEASTITGITWGYWCPGVKYEFVAPGTLKIYGDFEHGEQAARMTAFVGPEETFHMLMKNTRVLHIGPNIDRVGAFSYSPTDFGQYGGKGSFGSGLQTLYIDSGVRAIGSTAFFKNEGLQEVHISNSVTCISDEAFGKCTSLNSISLPSNLKRLGKGAFYQCEGLTKIDIPASVERIEKSTFAFCSNLQEVKLHDGLLSIHGQAFMGSGIRKLEIPKTVLRIGNSIVANCNNLESVSIYKKNKGGYKKDMLYGAKEGLKVIER